MGQGGGQDLPELKESQVRLVCLAETVSLVLQEHRDHRVSEVRWAQPGNRGPGDCQDKLDLRGYLVHQDMLQRSKEELWGPCPCRTRHWPRRCGLKVRLPEGFISEESSIGYFDLMNLNYQLPSFWLVALFVEMLFVLPGCPSGWANYRDKCYFFSKEQHSFDDAKASCESMSSSLLIINDLEEQVTHVHVLFHSRGVIPLVCCGFFWKGFDVTLCVPV